VHPVYDYLRGSVIGREKFGVAVAEELVDELEGLVDESADLGASRSETVEAIVTAYFRSDVTHTARIREFIMRRREKDF